MGQQKFYLAWNYDSLIWGSNDYIWSEVFIIIEIGQSLGGGGLALPTENPWKTVLDELRKKGVSEEKSKVFLQVIARVNGLVKTETKNLSDDIEKHVTVDHIRKTFDTFGQKVEVKVKNIKKR